MDTSVWLSLELFPTAPTKEKSQPAKDLQFQVFNYYLN